MSKQDKSSKGACQGAKPAAQSKPNCCGSDKKK